MPFNLIVVLLIVGGIVNVLFTNNSQYEDKLNDSYQEKNFAEFINGLEKATTNKKINE